MNMQNLADNFARYKGLTLAEWINQCSTPDYKNTDICPCRVYIGKSVYDACQYTFINYDEKYSRTCIYVLGKLPASYKHSTHIAYLAQGKEWYIGGYYQESNPKYDQFHYDINFMLFIWDIPNSRIDQYEKYPYRRMNMKIEYL